MIYFQKGSQTLSLTPEELKEGLFQALEILGSRKRILVIPPDFTRYHSRGGEITQYIWQYYGDKLANVLPALGTHAPLSQKDRHAMFGDIPENLFRDHNWRNDVMTLGTVPEDYIFHVSEGKLKFEWKAQVNELLINGDFDLILSVGQVVPHEVIGMANYNKNIFVGTGGLEGINKSHYLGAVYGMERIMGRADTPVRQVLNYATDHFSDHLLQVVYVHTVIGRDANGDLVVRGLYIGDDIECFNLAADLSRKVNIEMLEKPVEKVVVYLDPSEFKSTWLGNKAIYRTRMALADGAELIVLAPGLKEFGEDPEIDRLIRKYGYRGTPTTLEAVKSNPELQKNLSAAAHLIHGSSEGRFNITYCPGQLSKNEIQAVNFNYAGLEDMTRKYNPQKLKDGFNRVAGGEEIFYVSNPALGLWVYKERFDNPTYTS